MAERRIKIKKKADFFKSMPFNFCDRWCERCDLYDKCRAFQDMFVNRIEHIAKGEDPDSPAAIFADMRKAFVLATEVIKRDIQKQGIDPQKVKVTIVKEEIDKRLRPEIFPLWRLGHKFTLETQRLLTNVFSEQDEELLEIFDRLKKGIEELNWYHTFFDSKLYRALVDHQVLEKEKDKIFRSMVRQDMNVSAKLSYQALISCQRVLDQIFQNCRGYMSWARDLSVLTKFIAEKIEAQFPGLNKTKVIFHGAVTK